MDPLIWGPCLWKALFSISFNCTHSDIHMVVKLLKTLETVIPCPTCKAHYLVNRQSADKLFVLTKSCQNITYWLWHMKSLVNKDLKQKNLEFKYLKLRYDTFGHNICENELMDVLMMICIVNEKNSKNKFSEFLNCLATLCCRFLQGQVPSLLLCSDSPKASDFLNIVNVYRSSLGLKERTLDYYQKALN